MTFLLKEEPLNLHLEATKTGNTEMLARAFTDKALFVGTDDCEVMRIGELTAMMDQHPNVDWRMDLKSRQFTDTHAEIVEFLEFVNHVNYGPMRASGTLVWRDSYGWRINSYILSFHVPNKVVDETSFLELVANAEKQ